MIIDAHTHIGRMAHQPLDYVTIDDVVPFWNRYGIVKACLSSILGLACEPSEGNDMVKEAMERYPKRIIGFMTLNPKLGSESLREIDKRCKQGFRGIKLHPSINNYDGTGGGNFDITPKLLGPIIEKSLEYDLPILIHIAKSKAVTDGIDRILKEYPEAKIILAHLYDDLKERAEIVSKYPNVRCEISTVGNCKKDHLEEAVEIIGKDKLLFGTDFNTRYIQAALGVVNFAKIDEETREKILWKNSAEYFGIEEDGLRNVEKWVEQHRRI